MNKFQSVKAAWLAKGISEDTLDYAISSVKDGSKREHTLENLTADYRGMDPVQAGALLNELYAINGGEFKKENSRGYLFGSVLLLLGLLLAGFEYWQITNHSYKRLITIGLGAAAAIFVGLTLLIKSIRGKYRDTDEPFAS
ncbi:MAG: hypothetical protein JST68_32120 [Bacteroidetes bacterium]|nr:hypothetical protein [Bacteroidota bacterium]